MPTMNEHEVKGEFIRRDGHLLSGRYITPAGLTHMLNEQLHQLDPQRKPLTLWNVLGHIRRGNIQAEQLRNGRWLIRPAVARRVVRDYQPGRDWSPRRRSTAATTQQRRQRLRAVWEQAQAEGRTLRPSEAAREADVSPGMAGKYLRMWSEEAP